MICLKKCIVIPDSFKGFMTSSEVAESITTEVLNFYPDCEVISLPIADGASGTVDCIKNIANWELVDVDTVGPFNDPIKAKYAVNNQENTAVIESAQAVGLALAANRLDPSTASTYGLGLIIKDAIEKGYKNIILALGGSCTTDGGVGCAAALGVKFYDIYGVEFIPVGATLNKISKIDISECKKTIEGCSIDAMCDILSLMHGPNGTASIYSPCKGADINMVAMLDRNLVHLDNKFKTELSKDVSSIEGSGACGGLGATILAIFEGKLGSGIEYMLNIMDFNNICTDADLIITGEGCLDSRSLRGKTVYGIAKRVKDLQLDIPVVAIVGKNMLDFKTIEEAGLEAVSVVTPTYMQYEESKRRCRTFLRGAVDRLLTSRSVL